MPVRRSLTLLVGAVTLAGSLAGCGSAKLETGYTPTPLGDSPTQRRAYYAGPFSPEARNALMSESSDGAPGGGRRPN